MADSIKRVSIKFDIDASGMDTGGRKANAILQVQQETVSKLTKNYSLLEQAEKTRVQQINGQEAAFGKLVLTINKLQNSKLNQPLFEGAAKASVLGFNNLLESTNKTLSGAEERIRALKAAMASYEAGLLAEKKAPIDRSISAFSGLSVNTFSRTQIADEIAFNKNKAEQLLQIEKENSAKILREQEAAAQTRLAKHAQELKIREDQDKAYIDKLASLERTRTLGITTKRDDRGYVQNNQGTVAENRAKATKQIADNEALVSSILAQTRQRELSREEAYALQKQRIAKQTADRNLQVLQDQTAFAEQYQNAARNRELAALKADILARNAAQEAAIKKQAELRKQLVAQEVSSLQGKLGDRNAALQSEIDRRIAIERYGIKSIEVARIEAAERTRQLQSNLTNFIVRQQQRVAEGTIKASGAIARIDKAEKQYADAVLRANSALNAQERALGTNVRQHDALLLRVGKLIISYNILRNVWHQFTQSLRNIPLAGIAQQANQAPVLAIFGSAEGRKNLQFVEQTARSAGQALEGLETSYAKFSTSAVLAGEKQANVNQIFKDFAEVGSVFSLTQDKLDSVFLALDQMYGKGTVQSEELKKQLGNVLPGAVEIAAQAWARYTDSADKSISAFIKAMKDGLVKSKDLVPEYAKLFREIAGGKDDSVFNTIANKLIFNLNRLQTEYTLLNRAIFNDTQSTMNKIVRVLANAVVSIRTHLAGLEQVIQITAGLLTLRLGGALILAIGSIDKLIAVTSRFIVLLTGLSAPMLAAAAGVVYLYGKINALNMSYDKARGFTITFKDHTVSLTSYLQATAIIVWRRFASAVDTVTTALKNLINVDISNLWDNLIPNSKDMAEFTAFADALKEGFFVLPTLRTGKPSKSLSQLYTENLDKELKNIGAGQETIISKATAIDLAKYTEEFRGVSAQLVSEAIASGRLRTKEEITAALAETNEIGAPTFNVEASGPEQAGATAGRGFNKAYLAALKQIEKESSNFVREQERALNQLDIAFGRNEVSINSYYEKKRNLELTSIKNQELAADSSLQLARQNNDLQRIETFEAKKQELFIKTQSLQDDLDNQKYESLKQYNELQRTTNEEYLNYLGKIEEATASAAEAKYKDIRATAAANENENLVKQIDILVQAEKTKGKVIAIDTKRKRIVEEITAQEQKVNQQIQSGFTDQLLGSQQLLKLRNEKIQQYDLEIEKVQRLLDKNQENYDLQLKLKDLQREKENVIGDTGGIQRQKITGVGDFYQKFLDERTTLKASKQISDQQIGIQGPIQDGNKYGKQLEQQAAVDKEYTQQSAALYAGLYSSIGKLGGDTFEGLAAAARKMYGAQSKEARKAFMAQKAFRIAETAMATAQAVITQLNAGPYIGIALAAVAAAMGAVQIANIAAQQPPAAHGGLDYVPKEQTYLLDKGERVISPRQNKDLTNYINNNTINNNSGKATNNIRIINAVDPSVMQEYLGSTDGEEVIMNIVKRNQEAA